MRVINQALKFNKLPSEIARIHQEYEAFCFDEACEYIIKQLEDKNNQLVDLKLKCDCATLEKENTARENLSSLQKINELNKNGVTINKLKNMALKNLTTLISILYISKCQKASAHAKSMK